MCYLSDVCFRLLRLCRTLLQLLRISSCEPVHFAGDQQWGSGRLCTVIVYITCSTMASSDDRSCRPRDDRSGVHFRNEFLKTWNAPKSFIDKESPGAVTLGTSVVPDVLGPRVFYEDAEPVWVLPSMAENSVRILVPDDRAVTPSAAELQLNFGKCTQSIQYKSRSSS